MPEKEKTSPKRRVKGMAQVEVEPLTARLLERPLHTYLLLHHRRPLSSSSLSSSRSPPTTSSSPRSRAPHALFSTRFISHQIQNPHRRRRKQAREERKRERLSNDSESNNLYSIPAACPCACCFARRQRLRRPWCSLAHIQVIRY